MMVLIVNGVCKGTSFLFAKLGAAGPDEMTMWWLSARCCHFSHDFLMLFSHGSPPRNDKQMPNAFMDVIFLPSHALARTLHHLFLLLLPPSFSLFETSLLLFPCPVLSLSFCLCFGLSLPAGVVPDHCSGDYDPVFAAGRLLCLCLSGNRLLCLHHAGGAFCTQGAPTRYAPHTLKSILTNAANVKRAGLSVFKERVQAVLGEKNFWNAHCSVCILKNEALMRGLAVWSNKKTTWMIKSLISLQICPSRWQYKI